jgi:hypothetical protein
MEYDWDKVDQYTLSLLCFVGWQDGPTFQAWKGFDWETMNRLHEKGFISDPKGHAKSVILYEEGYREAEKLFQEFSGKKILIRLFQGG